MSLRWMSKWIGPESKASRHQRRKPGRRHGAWFKAWVEALEDRTLLSFGPPVLYPVGHGGNTVVAGDFNRDGIPDLATANYYDGTVSVLLNRGDGTFRAAANYAAGPNLRGVAAGDVNRDGILDLVTANYGGAGVSVLLGSGDGTFRAPATFATGGDTIFVTLVDVNRDGKLDAVAANANDNTVSILPGNGDGTFQAARVTGGFLSAIDVAAGDFDADGRPDLAVTNYYGTTISVLSGNGDGTFRPLGTYATGGSPIAIAVGDFNADGKQDLAVANEGGGVSVLRGDGNGSFQAAVNYPAGGVEPWSVAVGDLDGDGKQDLVVPNAGSDTFGLFLGRGDGTFQNVAIASSGTSFPTSVTVADLNGDFAPDLAIAGGADRVSVLLNQPEAVRLAVSAPSVVTAAIAFPFTVRAVTAFGTIDPNYRGTVHFTSTDSLAGLPADYTFAAADAGVHTFTATLRTRAGQAVTAVDTGNSSIGGSAAVTVNVPPGDVRLTATPASANEGDTVTLGGTFTDPDVNQAHVLTLSWGDGTVDAVNLPATSTLIAGQAVTGSDGSALTITAIDAGTGAVAFGNPHRYVDNPAPHPSAGGTYTIRLTVVDDAGGSAAVAPAGVAGWWKGEGNADGAVGGNGGTLVGGGYAAGEVGQAFDLRSASDYVQIPDAPALEPAQVTVEGWVKAPPQGSYAYLGGKGAAGGSNASYALYTDGSGGLFFYAAGTNGALAFSPDAGAGIWDDHWHHFAGTFDGHTIRLYVDGVEVGTGNPTGFTSIGYGLSSTNDLFLGTYAGSTGFFNFNGLLDEVSVYDRGLSAAEVRAIYDAGSAGKGGAGAATVAVTVANVAPRFSGSAAAFHEYSVPTASSGPDFITAGPDGNVWFNEIGNPFTDYTAGKVGRINLATGAVTEFPVPVITDGLISGPNGHLWFGEGTNIAEMDTNGTILHQYPVKTPAHSGVHLGPDGNVWYTQPYSGHALIGRMTPDGHADEFALPFEVADAVAGPDGNVWFEATSTNAIGRITPSGQVTGVFTLPGTRVVRGLTAGPDGNLWMTAAEGDQIFRVNLSGQVTGVYNLHPGSGAYGMTAGADGALWFAEGGSNRIGRITVNGVISEFTIPTANAGVGLVAVGPDGGIWFNEYNANRIGRLGVGSAVADQSAYPGAVTHFDLGAFTDPGSDNPWAVQVNWGDGAASDSFTAAAPGRLAADHAYAAPGVYTVTETVTDKDGASDTATFRVFVGTVVRNTSDAGPGSLRDVIRLANAHAGPDTITFALPAKDPRHFYYRNDGSPGQPNGTVSPANVAVTTAEDDRQIADLDPDYPHSWWSIQVGGPADTGAHVPLDPITDAVVIDGYTQAGAHANTLAGGDDAVLRVELDGSQVASGSAPFTYALELTAGPSRVSGLVINRFVGGFSPIGTGVWLSGGGSSGSAVTGNFIGTDVSGTLAFGGTGEQKVHPTNAPLIMNYGVFLSGPAGGPTANNRIGMGDDNNPADRNLLSAMNWGVAFNGATTNLIAGNFLGTDRTGTHRLGNMAGLGLLNDANETIRNNVISANHWGILIGAATTLQTPSTATRIWGNLIGTDVTGLQNLGNTGPGVGINGSSQIQVGGTAPGQGNTIAFNQGPGVAIVSASASLLATGNAILGNAIHDNVGPGIDLGNDGITTNPGHPAGTPGPNDWQHFPALEAAYAAPGGVLLTYSLGSTPNRQYRIEVFANAGPGHANGNNPGDPNRYGEGQLLVASFVAGTDAGGNVRETRWLTTAVDLAAYPYLSATATDLTTQDTSEFSATVAAVDAFRVTNIADGGPGSLRQALLNANAIPGTNTVTFAIPGAGVHPIAPGSSLPTITDPVVIDGTTQAGFVTGHPVIELTGSPAAGPDGLVLTTGGSTVRGLAIDSFTVDGLALVGSGAVGNLVQGNVLVHNGGAGITITQGASGNTVGGTTAAARNVISGNLYGVYLFGDGTSGNTVAGNYVGLDADGNPLGNTNQGVVVIRGASGNTIGGTAAGAGNVIAANGSDGVQIAGHSSANVVAGNFIGTDASGNAGLGNGQGIDVVESADNVIGTPGAGNVIAGNRGTGVVLTGAGSTGNAIAANSVGVAAGGAVALANGGDGIRIAGGASANQVGETGPGLLVASYGNSRLLRYTPGGVLLGPLDPANAAGLSGPADNLLIGPDGNLYVSSLGTHQVLRYDAATGAFLGVFAQTGPNDPRGIVFMPVGSSRVDLQACKLEYSIVSPK